MLPVLALMLLAAEAPTDEAVINARIADYNLKEEITFQLCKNVLEGGSGTSGTAARGYLSIWSDATCSALHMIKTRDTGEGCSMNFLRNMGDSFAPSGPACRDPFSHKQFQSSPTPVKGLPSALAKSDSWSEAASHGGSSRGYKARVKQFNSKQREAFEACTAAEGAKTTGPTKTKRIEGQCTFRETIAYEGKGLYLQRCTLRQFRLKPAFGASRKACNAILKPLVEADKAP